MNKTIHLMPGRWAIKADFLGVHSRIYILGRRTPFTMRTESFDPVRFAQLHNRLKEC